MRILIISLAGIGDTLIATPLIHELRTHYPSATIDAFVLYPGSKDLLRNSPHLNHVHQFNLLKAGPVRAMSFLLRLRREHYDVSLNTHPQSRQTYRIIARIIGAPLRLSHRYDQSGVLDRLFVNRQAEQDYTAHGVENNLQLLSLLGKKPSLTKHPFEVFLVDTDRSWATAFLAAERLSSRVLLGMHVGSGGTKNLTLKRWPLELYIELIGRLSKNHPNLTTLLLGGPEEEQAHARIKSELPEAAVLIPRTQSLLQAAALLEQCHAFLSVDTALMHLAAAMKVPNQVVIEAPTLNATNVPYGNPYQLVKNPVVHGHNLEYYRYDGGPIRGTHDELIACMRSVTVDNVFDALNRVLPEGV